MAAAAGQKQAGQPRRAAPGTFPLAAAAALRRPVCRWGGVAVRRRRRRRQASQAEAAAARLRQAFLAEGVAGRKWLAFLAAAAAARTRQAFLAEVAAARLRQAFLAEVAAARLRQAFLAEGVAARKRQAFPEEGVAARGKSAGGAPQREAFREGAPAVQRWQVVAAALAFQGADRLSHSARWLGVAVVPVCPKGVAAAWRPRACLVAAVAVLPQRPWAVWAVWAVWAEKGWRLRLAVWAVWAEKGWWLRACRAGEAGARPPGQQACQGAAEAWLCALQQPAWVAAGRRLPAAVPRQLPRLAWPFASPSSPLSRAVWLPRSRPIVQPTAPPACQAEVLRSSTACSAFPPSWNRPSPKLCGSPRPAARRDAKSLWRMRALRSPAAAREARRTRVVNCGTFAV